MRSRTAYAKTVQTAPRSVDVLYTGQASDKESHSGVGGGGGMSAPQHPFPGPTNPGQPVAMRKALAKKSKPDKGTSFPGLVR
jgi:hypothetical protein